MKFLVPLVALSLAARLSAADTPKIFAGLLEQNTPVNAQIGVVLPPAEIDKYVAKVEASARKDPKWFKEFSVSAKPGAPLPYDERIGLTKQEYEEYLALWNKREFKAIEDVVLMLRQTSGETWTITSTGSASMLSTLRYIAKDDSFRSPNGEMKRIADIVADPLSVLGEWTGMEWKFEQETSLGKTKENFALGRFGDKKYGLIVYRGQELSSEGTKLLDKSLVVRFPIAKGAQPKEVKPTPKVVPKTTPKPAKR